MRLKYLKFLFELEICFAAQQILNLAAYGITFYTAAVSSFYTKSGWHKPSAFKAFCIKLVKVKIRK